MKIVTILLLLLFASSAYGELTKEDLRTIIKEENTALEKRMKEYIDLKVDAVDQKLTAKIDALEGNVSRIWLAILALIAAAVALPQLIIVYSERKREKEIHLLVQQLREKNGVPPSSS